MKILIVDDDHLVTSGIQTIIEMTTATKNNPMIICAIATNGNEATELYLEHQPDVVLMDIRMPIKNGIEAGKTILTQDPLAKIIYLTTFQEDAYIIDALKIGAKGYLLKTDYPSLIPAIEAVYQGQRVFGDEIIAKLPQFLEKDTNPQRVLESLSATENQLIYYIAQGLNNKEIAQAIHLSEGTIRNYLSVILDKLALRDRTQLANYYYKNLV